MGKTGRAVGADTNQGCAARAGTATPCKPLAGGKCPSKHPLPCLGATEGQEVAPALCHFCK